MAKSDKSYRKRGDLEIYCSADEISRIDNLYHDRREDPDYDWMTKEEVYSDICEELGIGYNYGHHPVFKV